MPGPVPGIHVFRRSNFSAWMAGTSPAMTMNGNGTERRDHTSSQFELLRQRRFQPLFVTQFLGALNDNFFKNALVFLVTYRLAQEAGLKGQILVTAAGGLFILPFFLFSATA